jgi:hypothetical protein
MYVCIALRALVRRLYIRVPADGLVRLLRPIVVVVVDAVVHHVRHETRTEQSGRRTDRPDRHDLADVFARHGHAAHPVAQIWPRPFFFAQRVGAAGTNLFG